MAGRRHHYLPRFLQRPFAFRQKGKQFYVHAHHRAHGTYGSNVMELGQELDFYGDQTNTALDDEITRGETLLGLTVNRLNAGEAVSPEDIATLLAALSFRTKAMRNALTDLVSPIMAAARDYMLETRRLQQQLRETLNDPQECKKLIYEQIRKNFGNLNRDQQAKKYAQMLPIWKRYAQENEARFMVEFEAKATQVLDSLTNQAADIGDKSFLKALSRDPHMPLRAERMAKELSFELWDAPDGEFFILGDCGPVALFSDGKPRLALGAVDDQVEMTMIFLPISPRRCIVARQPKSMRTLGVADLNRLSAAASYDFFVSDQQDAPHLGELRHAIGTIEPIATKDEIARLLASD